MGDYSEGTRMVSSLTRNQVPALPVAGSNPVPSAQGRCPRPQGVGGSAPVPVSTCLFPSRIITIWV